MAEREPTAGDVLGGRYEIQTELGRGGMATVFSGLDHRLSRRVAIKVFRGGFAEAVDPQRTTQEMRLLAAVNHPSVVSVLDASNGDGVFGAYLVMELVQGDDLGALLHRARGPLAADFARRIVADVAGALGTLHAQGVVHRDVKPANILVPSSARTNPSGVAAKLTDFGIAQLVDGARLTAPDSILGTAAYLSPEQVRGAPPRPASDVYSLGLVLLEALTGRRAFPGPAAEAAMARLQRPPALPEDASPALADLLSRMTALDPAHRPDAVDVAAALRDGLVGRVTAPDAVQTAPTPVAGLAAAAAYAPTAADSTLPHEPLFTPSRGMHLSGPIPTVRRERRRFPTVLAVAAAALAAAVTGVAITAATTLNTSSITAEQGSGTSAPSSGAPVQQQAQGEADGKNVVNVAPRPSTKPSASASPKPSASSPSPSPTDSSSTPATPSETPTSTAPESTAPTATDPAPSDTPTTDDGASSDPTSTESDDSTLLDIPVLPGV